MQINLAPKVYKPREYMIECVQPNAHLIFMTMVREAFPNKSVASDYYDVRDLDKIRRTATTKAEEQRLAQEAIDREIALENRINSCPSCKCDVTSHYSELMKAQVYKCNSCCVTVMIGPTILNPNDIWNNLPR